MQDTRDPRTILVPELHTGPFDFRPYVFAVRKCLWEECVDRFDVVLDNFFDHELHERLIGYITSTPIDLGEVDMQIYIWQWTADYLVELFTEAQVVPPGSSWPLRIRGTPYSILEDIRRESCETLAYLCDDQFAIGRRRHVRRQ
ncbi:hypothetical protein PpBr36_07881 [Pyricularia pennisetigena]|uniref:hypothetical protein n=1 Tax=Pyricularia pennisetigena TaxID=1578925 RepID=UPI001152DFF8|nr:hypothetical protein PpBr36_07881 [Pyricularia pennisetigena]TLS25888.1 hypothetical protein PpBr36_07881 [Pyricularia pennisetigena]